MAQTNDSQEQVTVNVETLQPVTRTLMTIGALPTSYLISMTYEEQLLWLQNYLIKTVIPAINNNAEATQEVQDIVMALQDYINDYFNNLDVQEEINNKLDQMAQDGSLTTLIENYVNPYIQAQNQEINTFKVSVNNQIAQQNAQIQAVESGSPLVATSVSEMTDTTRVYVNTTNGNWYYYNGTEWVSGGVYQSSENSDTVNSLKNILNYTELTYTNGAYIPFSYNVIDVNNPVTNSDYKYSITECKENDIFTINGTGGNAPRLWFFTDEDYKTIYYSEINESASYKLLIAPPNSKYLIINDHDNKISFKNENVNDRFHRLEKNGLVENINPFEYQFGNIIISVRDQTAVQNVNYYASEIPIDSNKYSHLEIKANNNEYCRYAILKSPLIVGELADFATGYTETRRIESNMTENISIPEDGKYLYIYCGENPNKDANVPEKIILSCINEFINLASQKDEKSIIIAAYNSSTHDKQIADYICTGTNDETIINSAINSLIYGGTIQLLDGDYNIDSFTNPQNTAIYFNAGHARTITIKGTTENKSYASRYGVTIHVTETAISNMNDNDTYNLFNANNSHITVGDWNGAYYNNVNFENFYVFIHGVTKKVVGINAMYLGATEIKQVGIYSHMYFHDRFNHLKPATPVEGLIGVISPQESNDEMAKISFNCLNVGGLHTGIKTMGVEHLIMNTCTTARCCIGYHFAANSEKTLTMINCCDEGNTRLPVFDGYGQLTAIDFNIERFNADYIPDDPAGNVEHLATESSPNGWKGTIEYTLQGNAFGINKFWASNSGLQFKTRNLKANIRGTLFPTNPEVNQQYFKTNSNKLFIYNGTNWVDTMGNIIS